MDNFMISSDESDEESPCNKAGFCLSEAIDPVTTSYLNKITEEQWQMLATAHTDTETIRLLSGLCQDMVKAITCMMQDNMLPQVYTKMYGSSNTSTIMNKIDAPERDLSYYVIPEEAIQCRIWDTLSVSLAEGMGVEEDRSHNSNKLLKLVAGEVTRRVNQSITDFFYTPFFPPPSQSGGSDISCQSLVDDMVYHTAQILHRCFWKRLKEGSQDSEFSEFSSPDETTDSEELNSEDAESICSSSEESFVSDLSSPVKVTSRVESIDMAIKPIIKSCLRKITEHQWELLATDHTDIDTIKLLSGLCLDIVDEITDIVKEDMFDRIRRRMHEIGSSNTSIIMNKIRESEFDWVHYMVHKKTMQHRIGATLRWSVGAGMGVKAKRSHNTDKLLVLVSAEVTRRVNLTLAEIFTSNAFPQLHQAVKSNIANKSLVDEMVYHMVQILQWCLRRRKQLEEGSLEDDPNIISSPDSINDVEEFDTEGAKSICFTSERSVLSKFSGPDEVTRVEEFKAEDAESICSSSEGYVHTFDIIKASPRLAVDVSQKENFSGQKSTGAISTFVRKAQRFFRRNAARVSPACEVIQLENRSTPLPPKKKHPAVTRIFSSLAKVLRKPFTSCISGGSQDD